MTAPSDADRPLAVLTGGTGFLGSHVADALLAAGWRVRAAVRPASDLRWLQGKPLRTVIPGESDEGHDRLLADAVAVVHCAGAVRAPDYAGYRAGNVEPTRRLLAAAARAGGVRAFVHVSSLAACGPARDGRPRTETDAPAPVDDYGRSKLEAEALFSADLPFRWAILRPPALYGPRDRAFLPLFRWARRGWAPRALGGLRAVSLLDGRDCAAAAVALLATGSARGVFFADDGAVHGWDGIAAALAAAVGRRVRAFPVPVPLADALVRAGARLARGRLDPQATAKLTVPAWTCDGSRLRAVTGLPLPRDLATGFGQTREFYLAAGWLR